MRVPFSGYYPPPSTILTRLLVRLGLRCLHTVSSSPWRPCRVAWWGRPLRVAEPGRVCDDCGVIEALSPAEFYAFFGRAFIAYESEAFTQTVVR